MSTAADGGIDNETENTLDTRPDVHHAFDAWPKQFVTRPQQPGTCKS